MGDVNADGYDDIVIGEPEYGSSDGRASLYLGSVAGVPSTAAESWTGSSGATLGASVASAGDIDADGYPDVIVGAPSEGPGAAHLYHGEASSRTETTVEGGFDWHLDFGLSGAGDTNGDAARAGARSLSG